MGGTDFGDIFQVGVPATMPVVKELCGLDIVEKYLNYKMGGITKDTNDQITVEA